MGVLLRSVDPDRRRVRVAPIDGTARVGRDSRNARASRREAAVDVTVCPVRVRVVDCHGDGIRRHHGQTNRHGSWPINGSVLGANNRESRNPLVRILLARIEIPLERESVPDDESDADLTNWLE
jgi:hypothetical protein